MCQGTSSRGWEGGGEKKRNFRSDRQSFLGYLAVAGRSNMVGEVKAQTSKGRGRGEVHRELSKGQGKI